MADPLKLYYGRDTYAFLRKCGFCGKPYADTDEWTTMQGNYGGEADVWMLFCDECMEKMKEGGE